MNRPPTFNGKTRNLHALDEFLDDFKTYSITNNINGQQKLDLFDSLIRAPAQQEYTTALTNPAQMVWPDPLAADAPANLVAADQQARLETRIAWLRNQYQGPCQYQAI